MDIVENNFQTSVRDINNLTYKPTDYELLILYGLYKQSLFGDNIETKPSFFNFKGQKKWQAWTEQKGKSKIKAKIEYTSFANSLKNKKYDF